MLYMPSSHDFSAFKKTIWNYYRKHKRSMPWRSTRDPYKIFVSEVMLQQTQVDRVKTKYLLFVEEFPNFEKLARARLHEVLRAWNGLGYNRRALYLKKSAEIVVSLHDGRLPDDPRVLMTFLGVGAATAASIAACAFNKPTVFIETNIRSVFIHFFFAGKTKVYDRQIVSLVEKTLDHTKPREWYFALMDYGAMLKKKQRNPSRASAHHTRQSKFEGSARQIRGKILALLNRYDSLTQAVLITKIGDKERRTPAILAQLIREGLVVQEKNIVRLP